MTKAKCQHHYVLDDRDRGVCKHCGRVRRFTNAENIKGRRWNMDVIRHDIIADYRVREFQARQLAYGMRGRP